MLCFDLRPGPPKKCYSKVMHRKEVTHSNGSYEKESCGRKLADEMGRARKIPMVHYRVMHRKRVTSELHDSYFHLMMIKHSISKIEWASNNYIIELSLTSQLNWVLVPVEFDAQGGSWVEDRTELLMKWGRESHIRLKGPLGPDEWALGLRLSSTTERVRHKVTVITVGSRYYSLYSISSSLSHATLEQPFRTLAIKWEVNIFIKKSFLRLPSCVFVIASVFIIVSLWYSTWEYNIYRKLLTTKSNLLFEKILSYDIKYLEHINLYYSVFSYDIYKPWWRFPTESKKFICCNCFSYKRKIISIKYFCIWTKLWSRNALTQMNKSQNIYLSSIFTFSAYILSDSIHFSSHAYIWFFLILYLVLRRY